MMCDDGREATCQGGSQLHQTGQTMAECERHMRHDVERAGGVGQWLTAVKADHRAQLKAVLPQVEQMIALNPEYEKLLQDVSEPEPSAISSSDLGDMPGTRLFREAMERDREADLVNHPAHYGGDTAHEVIKCLEAWGLDEDAYLFNVVKYIARPGKGNYLTDLRKARFYLDRRIARMEGGS